MAPEFFIFKRLGNLLITGGEFCFNTTDQVLDWEKIIKNGGGENEIFGRIPVFGMDGIGNITPRNYSIRIKTLCRSVLKGIQNGESGQRNSQCAGYQFNIVE
ncbi:Uncharacterized protein Fot_07807 [Forsythia ovata]|uniref:Uncharacterized protein n=1 Tax=Forsythia ovata TaxID=205694 RepID=A0ABD1WWV8_9LAMI